jgi:hypothetical protein
MARNPLDRLHARQREARLAVAAEAEPAPAQAPAAAEEPTAEAVRAERPARMNPLERVKLRQASGAAIAAPVDLAPAGQPVGGLLRHYQDLCEKALREMSPMPAMGPERVEYKRTVALPRVLDFVQAYIDAREIYPNSVAVQACIWLFDIGDIERGLSLGLALAAGGQQIMPPRFERRDIETFLCDAVYDWANLKWKAKETASPYLDQLVLAMEAGKWVLHPAVASKTYAMAAKHAELQGDYPAVVEFCEKAMKVNPGGAGVKTLLGTARAKLAAQQNQGPADPQGST